MWKIKSYQFLYWRREGIWNGPSESFLVAFPTDNSEGDPWEGVVPCDGSVRLLGDLMINSAVDCKWYKVVLRFIRGACDKDYKYPMVASGLAEFQWLRVLSFMPAFTHLPPLPFSRNDVCQEVVTRPLAPILPADLDSFRWSPVTPSFLSRKFTGSACCERRSVHPLAVLYFFLERGRFDAWQARWPAPPPFCCLGEDEICRRSW